MWGDRARERQQGSRAIVAWSDSPVVARHYIHPRISGSRDVGWFDWALRRFFPAPADCVLSIGSGDGALERHGLSRWPGARFEAFDASTGAVAVARELARQHHLEDRVAYTVADLNVHEFEAHRYDVAFASASLHHLRDLEHVFSQLQRALKPGALLIANEFVGPNQFQWTEQQMALADALLLRLPEKYRRSVISGHVKVRCVRQPIVHMNAVDPTEAIRSSEIVPLMRAHFDFVKRLDYGGTLLNLILEEIAGNFEDTPEDLAVLEPLFETERDFIKRRVIASDFAVLIARNRPAPPAGGKAWNIDCPPDLW